MIRLLKSLLARNPRPTHLHLRLLPREPLPAHLDLHVDHRGNQVWPTPRPKPLFLPSGR